MNKEQTYKEQVHVEDSEPKKNSENTKEIYLNSGKQKKEITKDNEISDEEIKEIRKEELSLICSLHKNDLYPIDWWNGIDIYGDEEDFFTLLTNSNYIW